MTTQLILAGAFLAAAGMAQMHGGGYRGGYGAIGPVGPVGQGFGNVVFPGGGIAPSANTGHAASLGATVRGVYPAPQPGGGYYGGGHGGGMYRGGGGRAIVPVAVPVFVGGYGYGGGGYGYDYSQQPNVTVINAPQPQQTPTVIINQNYTPDQVRPVMRDYTREQLPEPMATYQAPIPSNPEPAPARLAGNKEDVPTIYLISLRDGTVYSCYAYWVENDTLHYITTRHSHNKASMDLVDVDVSEQLNRERRVEFRLKPSAK